MPAQTGILEAVPANAAFLTFRSNGNNPQQVIRSLAKAANGRDTVVGLGKPLLNLLDQSISGLTDFPVLSASGTAIPSTPQALFCWLRGGDPGDLLHKSRDLIALLSEAFELEEAISGFRYKEGRDLTGYVDGTENPEERSNEVALSPSAEIGMADSSFLAMQRWVHDLDRFSTFTASQQDHIIGRQIIDNEEIDDAPDSAHVKRTAQEDYEPEAFMLRRSMPYVRQREVGLQFLAFGHSLQAFSAQIRRMAGEDDGITDALFTFSRPVTGSYFWCPPVLDGHLDLRAIGL